MQAKLSSSLTGFALVVVNILSFALLSSLVFEHLLGLSYAGIDGAYLLTMQHLAAEWDNPSLAIGNSLILSYGNIRFPLNQSATTFFLLGHYWPALFQAPNDMVVIGVELFLATVVLARTIGLTLPASLLSGWAAVLVIMPFNSTIYFYPTTRLLPNAATIIAITMLIVAVLVALGRGGVKRTVALAMALFALIGYLLALNPVMTVLVAPFPAIFLLVLLVRSSDRVTLLPRLLAVAVVGAACLLLSWPQLVLGVGLYSPMHFFAEEYSTSGRQTLYDSSILFHAPYYGLIGPLLFIGAVLGMTLEIWKANRERRTIALALLFCIAAILTLAGLQVNLKTWVGPYLLYFERQLWAIYAIYAVIAAGHCIAIIGSISPRLRDRIGQGISHPALPLVAAGVLAVLPWGVLFFPSTVKSERAYFPMPPGETELVRYLKAHIGLTPGSALRGRVATFTSVGSDVDPVVWYDQYNSDAMLFTSPGFPNAHRTVGLWYFGIPGMTEYSQLMSPGYFAFWRRFFTRPHDTIIRNITLLTRPDLHRLRMLGVRFVITRELELTDTELVMTIPIDGSTGDAFRLYDLGFGNFSGVSPSRFSVKSTIEESLDVIGAPKFDWTETVILQNPPPSGAKKGLLATATIDEVTVVADGLHIRADSSSEAIIVLPMEYSACLKIEGIAGSQPPPFARLERANVVQTALRFSGNLDVLIAFRFGPFVNASCRLKDFLAFRMFAGPPISE